jgi:hypothetical protein
VPVAEYLMAEQAPITLEVYLGSVTGPSYGVWWDGEGLLYESFEPGYRSRQQLLLSPSQAQWRRFWRTMDQLGVWQWAERYQPRERFEPAGVIRDGMHWSLTLAEADREVESCGDSAGPDPGDLDEGPVFERFCEAISRLLGGRAFA